jgi:thioredoxin 2
MSMAESTQAQGTATADTAGQGIVRACPACATKNRVPAEHLASVGRCGSCKAELPALAEPLDADQALFDAVVKQSKVPVLVDFWAAWCGPCRMVAPEVQKTAASMAGQAVVLKVDTDRNPELAERFNVLSIPNFVVLKDGRPVMQRPGMVPQSTMEEWLRTA